jgi:hypothetical protein
MIGLQPSTDELERLRKAFASLNDVTRNIASVRKCIQKDDLRMAEHHLRAAEWHAGEASKAVTFVGQKTKLD